MIELLSISMDLVWPIWSQTKFRGCDKYIKSCKCYSFLLHNFWVNYSRFWRCGRKSGKFMKYFSASKQLQHIVKRADNEWERKAPTHPCIAHWYWRSCAMQNSVLRFSFSRGFFLASKHSRFFFLLIQMWPMPISIMMVPKPERSEEQVLGFGFLIA